MLPVASVGREEPQRGHQRSKFCIRHPSRGETMVVRSRALLFAVLALHVMIGSLAAPTGESSAGLAPAADGKVKHFGQGWQKFEHDRAGEAEDGEDASVATEEGEDASVATEEGEDASVATEEGEHASVEKDADGIVVCPLKVDSCLEARQAQIEAMQKAKAAEHMFKKAKGAMKKAKEAMAEAEAMEPGKAKARAKTKAGEKMEYWGAKMSEYGAEWGKAKNEWGAANRVANEEATNERKTGEKEKRAQNAADRAEKKKAREACSGHLNDAGECVHGGAASA